MAQVYNPWESPPTEHTLPGDLASFEINGESDVEVTAEAEYGKPLQEALAVISQQSQLIARLMDMLEFPAASSNIDSLD